MYRFTEHDEDGILEIRGEGFMSLAAYARYASELRRHVREARLCGRPVRLLIDTTDGEILPIDVAHRLSRLERELLTSALDRVAVVTPSSLKALQIRHIATSGRTQTFACLREGRRWLRAMAHNPLRREAA